MPETKINYSPETCALCGGTGKSRWPLLYDYCPACGGQGSVLVAQPARTCALCGGTGKSKWPLLYDYCPACGGTGWAHALRE